MTQTGGLVILLAWGIFAAILAVLAFLLLRPEKDPLEELSAPTSDHAAPAGGRPSAPKGNGRPAEGGPGSSGGC
jgi:hypothetical protein